MTLFEISKQAVEIEMMAEIDSGSGRAASDLGKLVQSLVLHIAALEDRLRILESPLRCKHPKWRVEFTFDERSLDSIERIKAQGHAVLE